MSAQLFLELAGYATGLTAMQRLESRHHIISTKAGISRHKGVPQISADMRRAQNGDIGDPVFQANFANYLSRINELCLGTWESLTELYDNITKQFTQSVLHIPLEQEAIMPKKFQHKLACLQLPQGQTENSEELAEISLQQNHLDSVLEVNKYYALKLNSFDPEHGLALQAQPEDPSSEYMVLQLLCSNPGNKQYIQRASFLSADETWALSIYSFQFVWLWFRYYLVSCGCCLVTNWLLWLLFGYQLVTFCMVIVWLLFGLCSFLGASKSLMSSYICSPVIKVRD